MKQAKKIKLITPLAYSMDFGTVIFIVRININGKNSYAQVESPNFDIDSENGEGLLISAITKHDYMEIKNPKAHTYKNYKQGLDALSRELK